MTIQSGAWILISLSLWAQDYSFRMFTTEDGLPSNTVYTFYQDPDGFLWMGNHESVTVFDGLHFRDPLAAFDKNLNRVRHIIDDGKNGIWLASHSGVIHVADGQMTVIDQSKGLVDTSTNDVLLDGMGTLWVATRRGLNRRLADGNWALFTQEHGLPDEVIHNLQVARDETLWVGTRKGLARFVEGRFQAVPLPVDGIPGIYALTVDSLQRLWVGTNLGLFVLEGNNWFRFGEAQGLPSVEVYALCVDRFGTLWVGTDGGPVLAPLADIENLVFESPGGGEVAFATIYSIFEDREGNIWFGSCNGVYQLRESALRNYHTVATGAGAVVLSLSADPQGRIWYGTDQGVLRREHGKNSFQQLDLPDLFVRALLATHEGGMWFGTRRGAVYRNGGRDLLLNRSSGMKDDHILSLHEAPDSTVYFGTLRGGLMAYRDGIQKWTSTRQGLAANRVYAFADDRIGGVWVGTESGLNRLGPKGVRDFPGILPGKEIGALLRDSRDRLWIGSNAGVAVLDGSELTFPGAGKGRSEDACRFIAEDPYGAIWVGGTRGLLRFYDNELKRFDGAAWTPREMNFGAWALDGMGHLWFGHFDGALRVDPARVVTPALPPPVLLTGFSILDKPMPLTQDQKLPYKHNFPRFSFTGLCYRAPDQLTFEYRLRGYDRDWMSISQNEIAYVGLAAGPYHFQVRARDRDGALSPQPAGLRFQILPPFWASWWFRVLLGLILFLLVVAQIRHLRLRNRLLANQVEAERVAKLQQEAELKLLHSQMNPHFLQNAFTSTIFFIKSSPEKAELMLTKLSTLFRKSMQAKRQVWSSVEDERDICLNYLEIQELRFGRRLRYGVFCPEHLAARPIPGFVLQPLVENAVLHGFREMVDHLEVTVDFSEDGAGTLFLRVSNTGQPLDGPLASLIRDGHALDNINKRLDLLGCRPIGYTFEDNRHHFSISLGVQGANGIGG